MCGHKLPPNTVQLPYPLPAPLHKAIAEPQEMTRVLTAVSMLGSQPWLTE